MRIDDPDFGEAFEIICVEGKEMSNTVQEHCGNKVSVVSLLAGHTMMNQESLPLGKSNVSMGEHYEEILEIF